MQARETSNPLILELGTLSTLQAGDVAGKNNYSMYLDGSGDYLDLGNISELNGANAVTVSTWVKAESTGEQTIFGVYEGSTSGFGLRIDRFTGQNRYQAIQRNGSNSNTGESDLGEVSTLSTGGTPDDSGLVAHYDFEEGSGGTATDKSGSGYTATLMDNATYSTDVGFSPLSEGNINISTQNAALNTLDVLEVQQTNLAQLRGKIGANNLILETEIANIRSRKIGCDAAASQIMDADIAHESAQLAAKRILQQAGSAVLAQANQQPALALQLLA